MPTRLESDAALFSMIHAVLDEQESQKPAERRGGDRKPFACPQLLAPYDGWTLPKQADFRLAPCHDLSPSGFSFLSQERPEYEYVVVALGTVPFTFFAAQVMHARLQGGRPGNPYLVGCRFLNRLNR